MSKTFILCNNQCKNETIKFIIKKNKNEYELYGLHLSSLSGLKMWSRLQYFVLIYFLDVKDDFLQKKIIEFHGELYIMQLINKKFENIIIFEKRYWANKFLTNYITPRLVELQLVGKENK